MPSGNPYHAQHVIDNCQYTDLMVAAAMEDLRQIMPEVIQDELARKEVAVKVEETAFQTAKRKIDELFKGIGRVWR